MMTNFVKPLRLEDCILYCLGHSSLSGSEMSPQERIHAKYYEIIIITDGEGKIYTGDISVDVKRNDIYLSFPFDVLRIEAEPGKVLEYDYIGFGVNSQKFGDEFNRIWSGSVSAENRVFSNENVSGIVKSVCAELEENPKAFSEELVSLLCSQMLVHIVRVFGEKTRLADYGDNSNLGLCGIVMNYVDTHLYTMKSLSEMAQDLGYNYSYLSTMFHKTTRTTLNSYYKTKRMDAARMLLAESKMTISKVAEIMNYSSVYAFSKAFKEHFGMSPSHYSSTKKDK